MRLGECGLLGGVGGGLCWQLAVIRVSVVVSWSFFSVFSFPKRVLISTVILRS